MDCDLRSNFCTYPLTYGGILVGVRAVPDRFLTIRNSMKLSSKTSNGLETS